MTESKCDAWHCETMIQSLERAKNMQFCLKSIDVASFPAVKCQYLGLQTSKLKKVLKNLGKIS